MRQWEFSERYFCSWFGVSILARKLTPKCAQGTVGVPSHCAIPVIWPTDLSTNASEWVF